MIETDALTLARQIRAKSLPDRSSRDGSTAKVIIDVTRPIGAYSRRHTLPSDAIVRAAARIAGQSRV